MKVPVTLPDGRPAVVEGELLDLDHRAKFGDATLGWRGDLTLSISVHGPSVEIWGFDRDLNPYLVTAVDSRAPGWKHDAIRNLAIGDWQRGDAPFNEVVAANAKLEADIAARHADEMDDLADKLHFALTKDVGHLEGGTRRLISMNVSRRDKKFLRKSRQQSRQKKDA